MCAGERVESIAGIFMVQLGKDASEELSEFLGRRCCMVNKRVGMADQGGGGQSVWDNIGRVFGILVIKRCR